MSVSSNDVMIDEPIVVNVRRENFGEWKLVKYSTLSEDDCWMRNPPPEIEKEVATNIRLYISPEKNHKFNVDSREDHTRSVTFTKAGKYVLSGESSVWCGSRVKNKSPDIEITVKNGTL